MQQLPSAKGNRSQHFANLNQHREEGFPAEDMTNRFWEIDEDIFDEFLNLLPPIYTTAGFRLIENLTDDITATFFKVEGRYWCGYTNTTDILPWKMAAHIREMTCS